MHLLVLAFLCGVLLYQIQAEAVPVAGGALLGLAFLLIPGSPRWLRLPVALALGFLWAAWRGGWVLENHLPTELEGRELELEGQVSSVPELDPDKLRFNFRVNRLRVDGEERPGPGQVRLSWYFRDDRAALWRSLEPGQSWRLQVKLKRPHALANPHGFDYSAWLFSARLRATGYVRLKQVPQRLPDAADAWLDRVNLWRYRLYRQMQASIGERPSFGLMTALTLGIRQDISPAQWDTLRHTGTSHLMAISGLHVSLLAFFAAALGRGLWRLGGRVLLWVPAAYAGAALGLLAAAAYALLAGFAVPTQRALIMVTVVLGGLLFGRRTPPSHTLSLALLLVLLWDPLAVLAPGFWLSFAAVTVIFYGLQNRVKLRHPWLRIHLLVLLGLAPLLLVWFGQIPLLSPLANLFAVPWVSFLVVPLALLGVVLLALIPQWAGPVLETSAQVLEWLWQSLDWLDAARWGIWYLPQVPLWTLLAASVGVALLLLPRGMPGRWVGLVWLLPALYYPLPRPEPGHAWFTLLDVGQGNAAVIRTRHHVLVYDSGPRFSDSFNAGTQLIAPFLRAQGVNQIDHLLLSHADQDHSGGAAGLLANLPVAHFSSGNPFAVGSRQAESCRAGQAWEWDGVRFAVLHPHRAEASDNASSCVLRVSAGPHAVLLSGDIEAASEADLLRRDPAAVRADILVVPHHGSKSSSSPAFIDAVAPSYALFSTGYRNRFGFPRAEVLQRYQTRGVRTLNTADTGAIGFVLGPPTLGEPGLSREQQRRYWHPRE